jgi:pimeloyl-ACP methyl ester carboxylesterase
MPFLTAAGHKLEFEWIESSNPGKPALVFLHEGLGSIRQWRDFPLRVSRATGCPALVYSRYGYGHSDVLAEPRRSVRFMHEEALEALPAVLAEAGIRNPILVGHSDGASIALIYAGAGNPVRALALMAPHVFVEEVCIRSIEQARRDFEATDLPQRLGKYHRDPRRSFYLWNDVWLDPEFLDWNIEEYLPGVTCPVLAIQGRDDRYGTMAQLRAIALKVKGPCELVELERCGHSPFRDQQDATIEVVSRFVSGIAVS